MLKTFEEFNKNFGKNDLIIGNLYKDTKDNSILVYFGYFKIENYVGSTKNRYRFYKFNSSSTYVSYKANFKDPLDIRYLKPMNISLIDYLKENKDEAVKFIKNITGQINYGRYNLRKQNLDELYLKIKNENPEFLEELKDYEDLDQIGLI